MHKSLRPLHQIQISPLKLNKLKHRCDTDICRWQSVLSGDIMLQTSSSSSTLQTMSSGSEHWEPLGAGAGFFRKCTSSLHTSENTTRKRGAQQECDSVRLGRGLAGLPDVLTRSRGRVVLAPQVWSAAGRRNVLLPSLSWSFCVSEPLWRAFSSPGACLPYQGYCSRPTKFCLHLWGQGRQLQANVADLHGCRKSCRRHGEMRTLLARINNPCFSGAKLRISRFFGAERCGALHPVQNLLLCHAAASASRAVPLAVPFRKRVSRLWSDRESVKNGQWLKIIRFHQFYT